VALVAVAAHVSIATATSATRTSLKPPTNLLNVCSP